MSEKQSTDELVEVLEIQLKEGWNCVITNLEIRAIIAKLRAADALISAIREESPLSANVRKAIAEYEGNA